MPPFHHNPCPWNRVQDAPCHDVKMQHFHQYASRDKFSTKCSRRSEEIHNISEHDALDFFTDDLRRSIYQFTPPTMQTGTSNNLTFALIMPVRFKNAVSTKLFRHDVVPYRRQTSIVLNVMTEFKKVSNTSM